MLIAVKVRDNKKDLIPAVVQSGFPTNEFLFVGFLPQKKGRQKKLKEIAQQNFTQVLYESPHRLLKLIKEIALYFGEEKQISPSCLATSNNSLCQSHGVYASL